MTQRPISLHQLSMMELTPIELVRVAATAGFDRICGFTSDASSGDAHFPLVTAALEHEMMRTLEGEGVAFHNIEIFFIGGATDVAAYEDALARGARLGGTRATAIINEEDDGRAADQLASFAELAGTMGIRAGLEFMAFTSVKTLDHAAHIVRKSGHANVSIALDPLHFVRNGATIANLAALPSEMIGYVQFNDGPAEMPSDQQWDEAIANRMPPGEGTFPLREMLALIPADRCLSVEAPMERRRAAGEDALARARVLAKGARSFENAAA